MTDRIECPVCDVGQLSPKTFDSDVEHGGKSLRVYGLECCVCSNCASEPILPDQIKRNQVRYADARRESDGLLTSDQVRAARGALGISQAEASELFGGGAHGFSKYERGEVMQSIPMDRLIRIVRAHPMLLDSLRIYAGKAPEAKAANDYFLTRPFQLEKRTDVKLRLVASSTLERSEPWRKTG